MEDCSSQCRTVATFGFFEIGIFGLLYGSCALAACDKALNNEPARSSLGYLFLVATGLGIAGGIIGDNPVGDPTPWARIIDDLSLRRIREQVRDAIGKVLNWDVKRDRPADRSATPVGQADGRRAGGVSATHGGRLAPRGAQRAAPRSAAPAGGPVDALMTAEDDPVIQ